MPIVQIRRNADGTIRQYVDEYPWQGDYIWADGNYSCDCNRFLFFERAAGNEPAWDEGECGDGAYSIKVTDENGAPLYQDDSWENPHQQHGRET